MKLSQYDFRETFGGTLSLASRLLIERYDWNYLKYGEQYIAEDILPHIEQVIERGEYTLAGDLNKWLTGWQEALAEFRNGGTDALVPQYLLKAPAVNALRFQGSYIRPADPLFELHWYEVLRQHLIDTYLADVPAVYEFGAGTGWNMLALASQKPNVTCVALDWASPAIRIAGIIRSRTGLSVYGQRFDFFQPDTTVKLAPECAVLTVGALEQTGARWEPFIGYLLDQKPKRVVHIEPMTELYVNTPFDEIAARYHRARGYWEGFLGYLRYLEVIGRAKIVTLRRMQFGSTYHEGYTLLVWEPT